jgi:predicted MPP superfamily phosphohydrolase
MVAVQQVSLAVPSLPEALHVVQLTDLHFGWNTPTARLVAAVEAANALEPDLVVLTGDVASWTRRSVRLVARTLGRLRPPRFAVLGNHDHHVGAALVGGALEDAGFDVLRNRWTAFAGLSVVGVDDPITGHADVAAATANAGAPCIGLVHDPRHAPELWRAGVPVVLAGHTHGGQFDVGQLPERVLRSRYVVGVHHTPLGSLYVCPGVGSASWRWRIGPRSQPAVGSIRLVPPAVSATS